MPVPVRITLGQQVWWTPPGRARWLFLAELAPRRSYFRADAATFDREYLAQLERHAGDIEAKLGWLTGAYGDICLCCFERRVRGPADCHRRLFAGWWEQRTGEVVPELDGT